MAEPRRTFRCEDALWAPAMATAEERGEVVSDVLRRCLGAYHRDPDGLLAAVSSPELDGPSAPCFSHAEVPVQAWRWARPLGYEHRNSRKPSQDVNSGR